MDSYGHYQTQKTVAFEEGRSQEENYRRSRPSTQK
jgi:hypothetical protein